MSSALYLPTERALLYSIPISYFYVFNILFSMKYGRDRCKLQCHLSYDELRVRVLIFVLLFMGTQIVKKLKSTQLISSFFQTHSLNMHHFLVSK